MFVADYLVQSARSSAPQLTQSAVNNIISDAVYGAESPRRVQQTDVIRLSSGVADGAAIFVLDRQYAMFLSPDEYRDAAEQQRIAMVAIKQALSDEASRKILPIIGKGHLSDRSFLVLPLCKPLMSGRVGRRLQQRRIVNEILPWLRNLASQPGQPAEATACRFSESLDALSKMNDLRDDVRAEAKRLEGILQCGGLKVAHSPMHGDLWRNNIMQKDGQLVIIDWAGSASQGYAIYDLLRFHQSFSLSRTRLRTELGWYIEKLGGKDAVSAHLLGALGHYAIRMGEFPRDRFLVLAGDCFSMLQSGLN